MWPPWIGARLDRCARPRASTRSDGPDRSQRRDFLSAEEGNDSEDKVAVDGRTAEKESTRAWPVQVNERRSCPWRARKMNQRCGYADQRVGEASHPGPRPRAVAWCWHGDCCPWHRQGKCFFRHNLETRVQPCRPDTVVQEDQDVTTLMEALVAIQKELAALKREVGELRDKDNQRKEKQRARNSRRKRRTPKEGDQDQTGKARIAAEDAKVGMSDGCGEQPGKEEDRQCLACCSNIVNTPPVWQSLVEPSQTACDREAEPKKKIDFGNEGNHEESEDELSEGHCSSHCSCGSSTCISCLRRMSDHSDESQSEEGEEEEEEEEDEEKDLEELAEAEEMAYRKLISTMSEIEELKGKGKGKRKKEKGKGKGSGMVTQQAKNQGRGRGGRRQAAGKSSSA